MIRYRKPCRKWVWLMLFRIHDKINGRWRLSYTYVPRTYRLTLFYSFIHSSNSSAVQFTANNFAHETQISSTLVVSFATPMIKYTRITLGNFGSRSAQNQFRIHGAFDLMAKKEHVIKYINRFSCIWTFFCLRFSFNSVP